MDIEWERPFALERPVEISLRFKRNPTGSIAVIRGPKEEGEQTLHTKWAYLRVDEASDAFSETMKDCQVDFHAYRMCGAKRCLKAWDMEGVPCTFENFCRLDVAVGMELLNRFFDAIMSYEHDEEGKQ